MRPSASPSWLAACSAVLLFIGCKTAPVVDWKIVDPTGFVNRNSVVIPFSDPRAEGISCVSPDDTFRFIKACRQGTGAPDMVLCAWGVSDSNFACSNEKIASSLELVNWSCLTARDWNRILTYCRRKTVDRIAE